LTRPVNLSEEVVTVEVETAEDVIAMIIYLGVLSLSCFVGKYISDLFNSRKK
jgi:hypothetical protein